MEGVQVSIDRIVVDFTDVFWEFFNLFQQRLRQYLHALLLEGKGVQVPSSCEGRWSLPAYLVSIDFCPEVEEEHAKNRVPSSML
jgi:hypothetical protein